MAVYTINNKVSPLSSVEFTPVADGNFTFFYVDTPLNKDTVKSWLTSKEIGQEIVAETTVNGHPVFVTHGDKTKDQIMKILEDRGDKLQLQIHKKPFNFWAWRGGLSMTGHPMQFISGWSKKGERDYSVVVFATLNLAANLVNIFFGAQRSPDEHRMRLIKNQMNSAVEENATLEQLINVDDKRSEVRKDEEGPKPMSQKFNEFMKRNSVSLGEVGLRYLGGISLVAPMGRWAGGARLASKEKSVMAGLKHILNPDTKTRTAGGFWLGGKTLAFFAKTPDPYNPEPKSTVDILREKWLFKLSTLSEMTGSTYLAMDRFKNPKRKIILGGKEYQDYLGGIGGLLFSTAFLMRLSAPYGVKEVNMDEVYAHATDTLAKTPPDKMPQLMADTAATLKEHLKDKPVDFGEIFTMMMTDMYRYHHIALNNLGTQPEEITAKQQHAAAPIETAPQTAVATGEETNHVQAVKSRKTMERAAKPATSFAEKTAKIAETAQPSHGMAS